VFGGGRLPMEALSEYDFYMDTHRLRISVSNMKNANTRDKLEAIRVSVLSNLSKLPAAPSAPLAPRPPSNFRVRARGAARMLPARRRQLA
jgi:histone deacetylase 1/2